MHVAPCREEYIFFDRLLLIGSEYAMYKYKFVRVDLGGIWTRKPKQEHHRLVEEYAKEGWRLVQIFSPAVSVMGGGTPDYFELIFERKVE